ncbi:SIS domain-containing protein [Azospirillum doebereinerae]|uniref:SIS domain-containing protein n=1 Tax=Azospirillum doebereinerae TaxID=92933 RepID=UPI001EE59C79|nr:SIS domain-containing protein [Azospirillum doebereinerae]MCG5241548.1 SIS domain-containing protein [Azospirillum doebereinerae]
MLAAIEASLGHLRRAETAVARVVLAAPDAVLGDSIGQLAAKAGVSEPTVLRFCRAAGFAGFQDFKLRLAQHLAATAARAQAARGTVALARDLEPGDSVGGAAEKVLNRAIDALTRLRDTLDPAALERAARALVKAGRVEIVGMGASGAVAQDAYHKLFRLLRSVAASSDAHLQAMAAATLGPGDVMLAISKTGTSKEILEAAAIAREGGATVIAITGAGTPLAALAGTLLVVDVDEDTAVHTPMASRLAQLALIDALTVAVGLLSPPDLNQRLARIKAALRGRHRTGDATPPARHLEET